jgi:hypothetical protein
MGRIARPVRLTAAIFRKSRRERLLISLCIIPVSNNNSMK